VVAGLLAAWGTAAGPSTWGLVGVVLLVALSALASHGSATGQALRGTLLLATAAAVVATDPGQQPLAMAGVLAVAAAYPFLLPRWAAVTIVASAVGTLAVPLVWAALPLGPTTEAARLLAQTDPTRAATTFGLLGAMAVTAALGLVSASARSALTSTAHLAESRGADAMRVSDELTRMATSDELTGLPNRRQLVTVAAKAMTRSDAVGGRVFLLLLELERFTGITDTFGPGAGDDVVRQVGRRLRAMRPAEDVVARVGQHQFAVLIEGVGPEGAGGVARRMTGLLETPATSRGRSISVTCSIGVAASDPGIETADDLVRAAEEALHAAQRGGRSRWMAFEPAMRAHSLHQASLEIELREALTRGEIRTAFQPVVELGAHPGADRPVAAEALARWTRHDGAAVPPQRFVPLAEELGLGPALGLAVLEQSLDAVASWRLLGTGLDQVWVNVSRSQLEDPDFASTLSARLAARGLTGACLTVEIAAESFVDSEQARTTLNMLRSLGAGVAVDHFGRTGLSLAGLRQLPLTVVKVDRRLTVDLGRDNAMGAALVGMCRATGVQVVVEGVETPAQLEAARVLGADGVQGFLLGRPADAEDVARTVRS
jgi:diguanylate cyclase (GGDEF)-like protein